MLYYRVSQKVSGNLEIVFGRLKTPGLAKILFLQNYLQDCNGYVHPHGIVADQSSIDQYGSLPSYWPRPWWCGLHVSLKYWGRPETTASWKTWSRIRIRIRIKLSALKQNCPHTQGRLSKARLTQSSLTLSADNTYLLFNKLCNTQHVLNKELGHPGKISWCFLVHS